MARFYLTVIFLVLYFLYKSIEFRSLSYGYYDTMVNARIIYKIAFIFSLFAALVCSILHLWFLIYEFDFFLFIIDCFKLCGGTVAQCEDFGWYENPKTALSSLLAKNTIPIYKIKGEVLDSEESFQYLINSNRRPKIIASSPQEISMAEIEDAFCGFSGQHQQPLLPLVTNPSSFRTFLAPRMLNSNECWVSLYHGNHFYKASVPVEELSLHLVQWKLSGEYFRSPILEVHPQLKSAIGLALNRLDSPAFVDTQEVMESIRHGGDRITCPRSGLARAWLGKDFFIRRNP